MCFRACNPALQMIMGAGKTTVIAPILALMLADGESLVFNVMPAALLEQARVLTTPSPLSPLHLARPA
jgi:hypothetical protein